MALLLLGRGESYCQTLPTDSGADGIMLNGISVIFDDRRAFFVRPGIPAEKFSLTEGRSAHGIKLLAVDARQNCVRVIFHGQTQTINICATPTLITAPKPDAAAAGNRSGFATKNDPATAENFATSTDTEHSIPPEISMPVVGSRAASATSTRNPNNDPTPAPSQPAGGTDLAEANIPPVPPMNGQPLWQVMSQYLEKVRVITAPQVAAGTADPVPLTPLTPAGTSTVFVGADQVFFNH
jgi:hypothetical protein